MNNEELENNQKLLDSMVLNRNSSIVKENDIGNCLSDFEILQVLGIGGFGYVAKVKSKKNLKIYAMKKYDLSLIEDKDLLKYYINESIFMKNLDHPNICKLYKKFMEGNNIYMIMEFMDNGDLFNFLNANLKLGKKIKEEKLWNIFEQCLKGLVYIHSKGLIHRDIKPANLLINNEGQVKLSDFNVSALTNIEKARNFTKDSKKENQLLNVCTQVGSGNFQAPEVRDIENEESPYDEKIDVYSMGITFCSLAFYKMIIPSNACQIYSKELVDIIRKMIIENKYYRPNSEQIYNDFIKAYVEKYIHSTGLISCINCLSLFPSFTNYFLQEGDNIGQSNEISYQLNKIIRALSLKNTKKNLYNSVMHNPEKKSFNYMLFEFRELLYKYGIKKVGNGSNEIEPISIISLLLKKMHEELNIKKNKIGRGIHLYSKVVQRSNRKQEAYENFMIFYNSNFESIISNNFFGLIKTKRKCKNCNIDDYFFNMLSFIPFNIQILKNQIKEVNRQLQITDAFDSLNKHFINLDENQYVKCENCLGKEHIEFKQFYNLPQNLIIFFDRGDNYKYKDFINFEEKLDLTNYVECFSHYKEKVIYDLLGIICKVEIKSTKKGNEDDDEKLLTREKYISFVLSPNDNIYIDMENYKTTNLNQIKKLGIVIGLFYYCNYVRPNFPNNDNNNSNLNINLPNNIMNQNNTMINNQNMNMNENNMAFMNNGNNIINPMVFSNGMININNQLNNNINNQNYNNNFNNNYNNFYINNNNFNNNINNNLNNSNIINNKFNNNNDINFNFNKNQNMNINNNNNFNNNMGFIQNKMNNNFNNINNNGFNQNDNFSNNNRFNQNNNNNNFSNINEFYQNNINNNGFNQNNNNFNNPKNNVNNNIFNQNNFNNNIFNQNIFNQNSNINNNYNEFNQNMINNNNNI